MHEAYEASTSAEDIDRDKNTTRKGQAAWMGSRLDERAAQFDVRTHKMKKGEAFLLCISLAGSHRQ